MATPRRVRIIAHRGHSSAAPENTIAAFGRAAALPCVDLIECDVRLTLDLEPVILHDPTVDRTTDGVGKIVTMALPQVRELDAGRWFDPSAAGLRVPTLGEFLDAIGEKVPLIEIKDPAACDAVLEELVRREMTATAVVQCFMPEVLIALRLRCPELPLGLLVEVPLTEEILSDAAGLSLTAVGCREDLLSADWIETFHRTGPAAWAWTVDEPARAVELADAGIDAIITNDPPAIADALAR